MTANTTTKSTTTTTATHRKLIREFKARTLDHARRECEEANAAGGLYTYGKERPHMGQNAKYVVAVWRETTTSNKQI